MKSILFVSLIGLVCGGHNIGHNDAITKVPTPIPTELEDILLVGPNTLNAARYRAQTTPVTNELREFGVVTQSGSGMAVFEEIDVNKGPEKFIELTPLFVRSHFVRVNLFSASKTQIYIGGYCLKRNGETCGFAVYPLIANADNFIAWIVRGRFMSRDIDHVRWSLYYKENSNVQFGDTFDVRYQGARSTCITSPLRSPCELLCYGTEDYPMLECTEALSRIRLPCSCTQQQPQQRASSDGELATRIVAISVIIVVGCIVGCCSFYYWKTRSKAAATVETRRQEQTRHNETYPQTQAEIETTATSLMEQLSGGQASPDGQACCVCLETTTSSPDAEDTWISTPCNHNMHHDCLKQWLVQRLTKKHPMTCPVCRASLSETVGPAATPETPTPTPETPTPTPETPETPPPIAETPTPAARDDELAEGSPDMV